MNIIKCVGFLFLLYSCENSSTIEDSNIEDQWYVGGTLHEATASEWKSATYKNKLATCADYVANIKKANNDSYNGDLTSMKKDAIEMMACIDESIRGNQSESIRTNEICAACAVLMQKNN